MFISTKKHIFETNARDISISIEKYQNRLDYLREKFGNDPSLYIRYMNVKGSKNIFSEMLFIEHTIKNLQGDLQNINKMLYQLERDEYQSYKTKNDYKFILNKFEAL